MRRKVDHPLSAWLVFVTDAAAAATATAAAAAATARNVIVADETPRSRSTSGFGSARFNGPVGDAGPLGAGGGVVDVQGDAGACPVGNEGC